MVPSWTLTIFSQELYRRQREYKKNQRRICRGKDTLQSEMLLYDHNGLFLFLLPFFSPMPVFNPSQRRCSLIDKGYLFLSSCTLVLCCQHGFQLSNWLTFVPFLSLCNIKALKYWSCWCSCICAQLTFSYRLVKFVLLAFFACVFSHVGSKFVMRDLKVTTERKRSESNALERGLLSN